VSLSGAWEDHADEWIAWARTSSFDGFWKGTWPALRTLLPEPGPGPVIDVGCGEGRAGRELIKLGYQVVGVDRSPTLAAAASSARPAIPVLLADAAAPSFRFSRPYLEPRRYVDHVERGGLAMTFTSMHRPLSGYVSALAANGMMISALSESGGGNIPWLLAARADKITR
jgi:SAM-dependent methyltransferase